MREIPEFVTLMENAEAMSQLELFPTSMRNKLIIIQKETQELMFANKMISTTLGYSEFWRLVLIIPSHFISCKVLVLDIGTYLCVLTFLCRVPMSTLCSRPTCANATFENTAVIKVSNDRSAAQAQHGEDLILNGTNVILRHWV
ncbi:Hypothetical Protein FCC1311_109782 [Hondaea fermentalgiana]|uniref:Uncharacterized protein n=1 Tax=Hondaea fermentalgiana TaxID=2315210 RepID=A0A2R5GV83_9STRA|nr:Hypothetical Protein FCC1311_109782 [Hondaea fermentalgiana]|eukprot:GBG34756.1 Hypothetical Protein FCC1311_109782 [Hondaea fermentalgiana]